MASVRSRFFTSFVANLLRGGISFATALVLARLLGAVEFGRLAFLLASFMALRQMLDMSTSSAFFTFLSQRPRSRRFVSYYWRWLGSQLLFAIVCIGALLPLSWLSAVWEGENRAIVLLALVAAFMQQSVWPVASQMAEASRETARVQGLTTLIVILHLVAVACLWLMGLLAVPVLLIVVAFEWAVGSWLAMQLYKPLDTQDDNNTDTPMSVWNEFLAYCLPLVPYTLIGFASELADRWMLQHWGGASEQAYYSIAQQFSGVALLATTSILRIFWKEIAEAHYRGDMERVAFLNRKVSRALYFVGAVTAGAFIPWSEEIVKLLLGSEYHAGWITLMIMFLYPVHQCLGQICGSMLLATNQTKIYVTLGVFSMTLGLIASYLIIAPSTAPVPGFGMASKGLAIKMVGIQIISVNLLAFFIARRFSWRFDYIYQIVVFGYVVVIGWLVKSSVSVLLDIPVISKMVLATILYVMLATGTLFVTPVLAGFQKGELNSVFYIMLERFGLRNRG